MNSSPVVWLASYPRSGNTMVRRMVHDATGWPTFSVYNDRRLDRTEREKLGHVALSRRDWVKPNWRPLSPPGHPMFVKTHEWPTPGDRRPVILIVRDGRDVCASYARYLVKKMKFDAGSALDHVIIGKVPFGAWGGWNRRWMSVPEVRILKYERILERPEILAEAVYNICGMTLDGLSVPDLGPSLATDPGFFHRGGSWWSEVFSKRQIRMFWSVHGDTMTLLGYDK